MHGYITAFALLKLSGPDAALFLQGQITQDIYLACADQPLYAAFCNREGRVLFLAHIWQKEGDFYLYSPTPLRMPWLAHLQKYSRFSKLKIEDLSDDYEVLLEEPEAISPQTSLFVWQAPLHQEIIQIRSTEEVPEATSSFWKIARIKTLYPILYPETSGLFLAHHLNLHRMQCIHFQKGCYLGQEIVARMEFRSKPKRELLILESPSLLNPIDGSPLQPGDPILVDNTPIGELVDTAKDPETGEHWTLAVVENRHVFQNQICIQGQSVPNLKLRPPVVG